MGFITKDGRRIFIKDGPSQVPNRGEVQRPGITPPAREGFVPVDKKAGKFFSDHAEHAARLEKLKLPPGWTNVQLSKDPSSPLQATGQDSKGRTQYIYSEEHSGKAAAEKFDRVKAFVAKLPQLQKQIAADFTAGKEEAAVLHLISKTGFRIGSDSDTGAKVQAYGASTLKTSHAKVNGNKVAFNFIGKKGVQISQTVEDPALAAHVTAKKAIGGRLFDTSDSKVRDYLGTIGGKGFKPKDFRTAVAASTALEAINNHPTPTNRKEFETARKNVGKVVAAKLGNTHTVALASYIPPEVFRKWEAGISGM